MNQIPNIEETHNAREFRKDFQNSFNCLFCWWINGMAFGLGILVVLKISELWTM